LGEHRREEVESEGLFFGTSLAGLQAQLQKILEADRRMATELPPVLIEGETGTGKTTFARWLHEHGPRAERPLVEVNCSALPESLAESELFGHERGAFTDAKATRLGLFEAAGGGTLLLDEVPSLSLGLQAKVLKAIEDRTIRRIGSTKTIAVDVRIVAASNRNLKEAVAQGQFREDLYHRLDLYRLSVPPLRERGEDISKLAELMVERLCERQRLPVKTISPIGRRRLLSYHWPGNVRELAHELERAIVFEDGTALNFPQLGPGADEAAPEPLSKQDWFNSDYDFAGFSLEVAIDRFIQVAMQRADGNVSGAARLLNVPRDYVRYRLYGPRIKKSGTADGQQSQS
jgi:DNA-binding NtrC family response regulator